MGSKGIKFIEKWISVTVSILNHNILTLTTLRIKLFKNMVQKGENAGNQQFLRFTRYFLPSHRQSLLFEPHLLSSAHAFNLVLCKVLLFGKGLSCDVVK